MTSLPTDDKILILFDGVCNLCNGSVQFIIRRDPEAKFRFASLQSEAGRELMRRFGVNPDALHSVLVIDNGKLYERSDAALHVAAKMGGAWKLLSALRIVPQPVRDAVYDLIARKRYKWFGKRDECMLPTPELKSRFLE